MLSLMVAMHDMSAEHHEDMNRQHRVIAEKTVEMTENSLSLTDEVANLASTLSSLELKISSTSIGKDSRPEESDHNIVSAHVQDILSEHEMHLTDKFTQLSTHLEKLDAEVAAISGNVRQLLPTLTREILARRQILDSLWYSKMHHRRTHITRAHSNTYQWIFTPKEDAVAVWDDFVEWLNEDDNPIYWVTGKPGSGKR